jgi:hypothetical protein
MKVAKLRAECEDAEISSSGKKSELVERLVEFNLLAEAKGSLQEESMVDEVVEEAVEEQEAVREEGEDVGSGMSDGEATQHQVCLDETLPEFWNGRRVMAKVEGRWNSGLVEVRDGVQTIVYDDEDIDDEEVELPDETVELEMRMTFKKMKVAKLRAECEDAEISSSGKKSELVERLVEFNLLAEAKDSLQEESMVDEVVEEAVEEQEKNDEEEGGDDEDLDAWIAKMKAKADEGEDDGTEDKVTEDPQKVEVKEEEDEEDLDAWIAKMKAKSDDGESDEAEEVAEDPPEENTEVLTREERFAAFMILKAKDLVMLCKKANLNSKGKKAILTERLIEAGVEI